jgi:hypothetical protein
MFEQVVLCIRHLLLNIITCVPLSCSLLGYKREDGSFKIINQFFSTRIGFSQYYTAHHTTSKALQHSIPIIQWP